MHTVRLGAIAALLIFGATTRAADFYVSPSGNDANAGTIAQPFATITKAQEAVRTAKAGGGDVNVYLRGGTYAVRSPLTFTQADGGTGAQKITYQAYQSECVAISGGRQITGWTKGSGNLWTVDIPEVKSGAWYFRELFVNDKRMPRGRFPNGQGIMQITAVTDQQHFTVAQVISENLAGKDAEAVAYHQWTEQRAIVASNTGTSITTVSVIGHSDHADYTDISAGCNIHFENALSFVDQAGEWYLDRATGTLTYLAAANEDPNTESCIAPFSEKLLIVRGAKGSPVQGIHFVGIKFQHSKWTFPSATGYVPMQSGVFDVNTRATPSYMVPMALDFRWAQNCSLEKCRIAHIGQTGIGFGLGARYNKVTGCEIVDIAGHGCDIGHPGDTINQGSWSINVTDAASVAKGNEISNCYVHKCGAVFFDCDGIFSICSDSTTISHNYVTDCSYTGIGFGFTWGATPTAMNNCRVANNHVYDVMHTLGDGGCIYSLGYQPGSLVIGNHCHMTGPTATCLATWCGFVGLYYDQGSTYTSRDNISYDNETLDEQFAPNANMTTINNKLGDAVTQADKDAYSKSAGLESAYAWLLDPNAWTTCAATVSCPRGDARKPAGARGMTSGNERLTVFDPEGRRLVPSTVPSRTAGVYIVRPEGVAGGPLVRVVNVDRR